MRGDGPTVFAQVKNDKGVDAVVVYVNAALIEATAALTEATAALTEATAT
jgi:hypothetical protein